MSCLQWEQKLYSLIILPNTRRWWLAQSLDLGANWSEIADLKHLAFPQNYCLTRYNNYLFWGTGAGIYFFDGTRIGDAHEELDFPRGETPLKTISGTNNGLLFTYENLRGFYQIVDFSPQKIIAPVNELPTIYVEPLVHQTDSLLLNVLQTSVQNIQSAVLDFSSRSQGNMEVTSEERQVQVD